MKKTLTILAIVIIAINSFAQRSTKQYKFMPDKKVQSDSKLKKPIKTEKSTNLNVTWEEHFDNYNTANTNGIPNGWEIISTATDTLNQWRVLTDHGDEAPEIGIPWSGASSSRDEILITSEFMVNDANPALWFDFSTSFEWFVENNSDDIIVSISDDNFATETIIWREDDSTMVANSRVTWPYYNYQQYTAMVDLSNWAGNTVKVKFHILSNDTVATHGVSFYLDNVMSVQTPNYDLAIENSWVNMNNNGIYNLFPEQCNDFHLNGFGAVVRNNGVNELTNCKLKTSLLLNSDTLFTYIVDTFINGNNSLSSNFDTFVYACDTICFNQLGNYEIVQEVYSDNYEDDLTNNKYIYPIEVFWCQPGDLPFIREQRINSEINLANYENGESGDEVGYVFSVSNMFVLTGIVVKISQNSTEGAKIRSFLYHWDNDSSEYVRIGNSQERTITTSDIGNLLYLQYAIPIDSLENYLVTVSMMWEPGVTDISILSYDGYRSDSLYKDVTRVYSQNDSSWSYIRNIPFIEVFTDWCYLENIEENNLNQNIKLYPNPTKGIINVENINENSIIEIFDMSGSKVYSKNNVYNDVQIDVSSLLSGTYLVKIFIDENIVIKKLTIF